MFPPMWADFRNALQWHFYIKELAQLQDGQFVIPLRWLTVDSNMCADVLMVAHYAEVCVLNGVANQQL